MRQNITNFIRQLIALYCFIAVGCTKPPATNRQAQPTQPTAPTPTITRLQPDRGYVSTIDTIIGTNFSTNKEEDSVYYNGIKATVLSATATQLIVSVPDGATTGPVTLKLNGATASGHVFTVLPYPTIMPITPTHGVATITDTIYGTNFHSNPAHHTVLYNNVKADIVSFTPTRLVVKVPESTTGNVTITTNGVTFKGPVFTYDEDSVMVSTLAGTDAEGSTDGPVATATFRYVWDVSSDPAGNVYVADGGSNMIRKITGGMVTTVAGAGSQPDGYGPGTLFHRPKAVYLDKSGKIYLSESMEIKILNGIESVSTFVNSNNTGFWRDGTLLNYAYMNIRSMVKDKNGNLFVADENNHSIRKITPDGTISLLAGGGPGTPDYQDGVGITAYFRIPTGITIDRDDNLYVADRGNNRIRKITPAGVVTTIAGKHGGGSEDGQGTSAAFSFPTGIAIDATNNLYVSDFAKNRIRKITPSGWVSTIAGTGAEGAKDGPGRQATFSHLGGLSMDAAGNLYVADGKRVRKITFKR